MSSQNSPLWQRVAAFVLASGVIASFIYFLINPPLESSTALAIIRFLAASAAAYSAFLFFGSIDLEARLPFNRGVIRATGSFAVFIAVFFLFFFGIPDKPIGTSSGNSNTPSASPSISDKPTGESSGNPNTPSASPLISNKPTGESSVSDSTNKQSVINKHSLIIILDASGSMTSPFSMTSPLKNKSKIDVAKQAIRKIILELPTDREFGLMAYGNGSANSCDALDTIANLGNNKKETVLSNLSQVKAEGTTPITASIKKVAEFIKDRKEETTILLVSDGQETCGGDPCKLVKKLKSEGYKFSLFPVGIDTDLQADQQLACLAKEGGGVYTKITPDNPDGIIEELERVALGGQFRIKKPIVKTVEGWKLISKVGDSQEPVLLVRKQSASQLWNTYPLDPGLYDVYLFIKNEKDSTLVGQVEIRKNQIVEFDTRK